MGSLSEKGGKRGEGVIAIGRRGTQKASQRGPGNLSHTGHEGLYWGWGWAVGWGWRECRGHAWGIIT